jgi:hypothetical protein
VKSLRELLGFWWISWFGFIGAFFLVGGLEYKRESSKGGRASYFSLILLIIITLTWILFYAVQAKAREKVDGEKNKHVVVDSLTMAGSFLAMFTILGIFYFLYIAQRIQ